MGRDKNPPGNCEAFVDVNNMVTCEVAAFKAFLSVAKKQSVSLILLSSS